MCFLKKVPPRAGGCRVSSCGLKFEHPPPALFPSGGGKTLHFLSSKLPFLPSSLSFPFSFHTLSFPPLFFSLFFLLRISLRILRILQLFCKSEIIRKIFSPDFSIIFSIVATMAISSYGASVNWLKKQKRAKAIYNKHFPIRCLC